MRTGGPARLPLALLLAVTGCRCDAPPPEPAGAGTAVPLDALVAAARTAAHAERYRASVGHTERDVALDGPAPSGPDGDRVAILTFEAREGECEPGDLTEPARAVHQANVVHGCAEPTVCTRVFCVGSTRAFMLVGVDAAHAALWSEGTQRPAVALIPGSVREALQ